MARILNYYSCAVIFAAPAERIHDIRIVSDNGTASFHLNELWLMDDVAFIELISLNKQRYAVRIFNVNLN